MNELKSCPKCGNTKIAKAEQHFTLDLDNPPKGIQDIPNRYCAPCNYEWVEK